eukprot:354469-Chlamydomonas_euryale.AAC.3
MLAGEIERVVARGKHELTWRHPSDCECVYGIEGTIACVNMQSSYMLHLPSCHGMARHGSKCSCAVYGVA